MLASEFFANRKRVTPAPRPNFLAALALVNKMYGDKQRDIFARQLTGMNYQDLARKAGE